MDPARSAHVRGAGRLSGLPVVKALFSCEADTAATALSPVTNLALTMDQLAVLGSQCETPKRKLGMPPGRSLSRGHSSDSMDAGLGLDSPGTMDREDMEEKFEKAIRDSGRFIHTRLPIRRIHSLPQKFLGSSPAFKRSSADSLDCDVFQSSEFEENKENEAFQFKMPTRPVSRGCLRSRYLGEGKDALVHRQKSAPARMFSSPGKDTEVGNAELVMVRKSSMSSATTESSDDGFSEMLGAEDLENDMDFPSGMASLWTAPLVMSNTDHCHEVKSRRALISAGRPALKKRLEVTQDEMPEKSKRRRSMFEMTNEEQPEKEQNSSLVRSKSFSSEEIESILDNDQRDVIGDFSRVYLFPTVDGRHQDLKYITPEMMVLILSGRFDHFIERCVIIDCRYPYEYDGGHIKGAINLHMEQEVEAHLLKDPILPSDGKRVIVMFHCEFSSERGPRMCRFVREKDRDMNVYPSLYYPELYMLQGGYKDFFKKSQAFCEPQGYRPMQHKDFKEDLRRFRMKSRTWAGEKSKRELYSRLKKL
ncbi:M-phase inducer phosphatase 1 [Ascaphus truei]|uniref:M-phase inducer phosphatase 1 n=1 Tax=Ascaphus truei TaxID=8439 RepID=UPI003F59A5AD